MTGWAFLSGERGREEKHELKKNTLQLFVNRRKQGRLHIFLLSVVIFYTKLLSVVLVFMDFILYSFPQGGVVMNTNLVESNNRIGGVVNHGMNSNQTGRKEFPNRYAILCWHLAQILQRHMAPKWRTASVRLATLLALQKGWRPTAVMIQPFFGATTIS